jgi:hypothetical protein
MASNLPVVAAPWPINIVRYDVQPASSFLANPDNFRIHPLHQQAATEGSLDELGWIDDVIVNLRLGAEWGADQGVETMVNGHLRVSLALRRGDETPVPVKFVNLSPSQEALALQIFDELTSQAIKDREKMAALQQKVMPANASLQEMCAGMAAKDGITPPHHLQPVRIDDRGRLHEHGQIECPECGAMFAPHASTPWIRHNLMD